MFNLEHKDKNLKNIISGKKVIVVGPATYLVGKEQGNIIDSYDVVVRPNQFSVPDKLHCDYGSRTDVMFHNCGTPWMVGFKEQIENNPIDFDNLKMVVCPTIKADHSEGNFLSWPDDHKSACATNFNQVNRNDIPFYWIGVGDYKKLFSNIGCEPYTGMLTIMMLSEYEPKELHVTGFDFYTGTKVYHDGFLASVDKDCEQQNRNGSHGGGCNDLQIRFLSEWITNEKYSFTPTVDSTLLTMLKERK